MKGYIENIKNLSLENVNFRKVLYTTKNSQLVVLTSAISMTTPAF